MFGKLQKTFWMSKTTIQAVTCRLLKFIRNLPLNLKVLEDPGQQKSPLTTTGMDGKTGLLSSIRAVDQPVGHCSRQWECPLIPHKKAPGVSEVHSLGITCVLVWRPEIVLVLSTSWRSGGCEVSFSLTLVYQVSDNWQIGSPHVSVGSLYSHLNCSPAVSVELDSSTLQKSHILCERGRYLN